jgi:U3 small nucleolar RNA-associated protein 12
MSTSPRIKSFFLVLSRDIPRFQCNMVRAYSRYNSSGTIGLIHGDAPGQSLCWSKGGKTLFSITGARVSELNSKTGTITASVSASRPYSDEGLHSSALSLRQPARPSTISCSSEYLGIGCSDGSVRIMELPISESDVQACGYQGHRGSVNALAFGENSGLVASGGRDTEIVLWDMVGDSAVCRFVGHKSEITCLSFLPGNDDFVVSGSKDGTVKVWSVKLQICVQTVTDVGSDVWSLCFHGNDRMIVGSAAKVLHVFSVRSNLVIDSDGLTVLDAHGQLDRPEPADGRVVGLGLAGDCLFAETDRRVIELWRTVSEDSEKVKRMKRRLKRKSGEDKAEDTGFRASDEYVLASSVENASVALRYVANSTVKAMAVNPIVGSGSVCQVALGLNDNSIELFKVGPDTDTSSLAIKESRAIKREGHRLAVAGLSLSSNGNRLMSVSGDSLIIWNAISLAFQRSLQSPSGEIVEAWFVPGDSDRVALFTREGHCSVLDINSGVPVNEGYHMWDATTNPGSGKKRKSNPGINEIKCVHMYISEEDNKQVMFLVGEKDKRVTILKLGTENYEFEAIASHGLNDEPVTLEMSPKTNKYIACGLMSGNVELIYSDTGKHFMSLYSHKLAASAVAFSPDEQVLVSGSSDKSIKIWSVKFGNVLKTIKAHDSGVTNLMFVPHTHLVFSSGRDGVVSLWDIDRFERVMSKVAHPSAEVLAIAMSPDAGMVFSSGSDKGIQRITRGEDQMFIEEEAEKALELEAEAEAQRDDLVGTEAAATKSSIESVRMLEKVIAMIEIDEEELGSPEAVKEKKKELIRFVCTELPNGDLQQVAVTLPTGHARRLLAVLAEVMEDAISLKNGKRVFPIGFPVEQCITTGLYIIQAQAKFLIGEPHSRAVLLKLKELFHFAVQHEIHHVGTAAASVRFI